MRPPALLVHTGLPGSGVDVVQTALRAARAELRRGGVGFLGDRELAGFWQRCRRLENGDVDLYEHASKRLRLLIAREQIVAPPPRGQRSVVVLSSTRFVTDDRSQPAEPESAARWFSALLAAMASSTPDLVFQVRRPDRLIEAEFLSRYFSGETGSFEEHVRARSRLADDQAELAVRLRSALPDSALRVLPYECGQAGSTAALSAFLAAAGIAERAGAAVVATKPVQPRVFTDQAWAIARALSEHVDTTDERRRVRRFVARTYTEPGGELARLLGSDARQELLAAAADSNRLLLTGFGNHFPADSYVDDDRSARLTAPDPSASPRLPASRRRAVLARAARALARLTHTRRRLFRQA